MDQSKALQKLTESADLVGMIEELVRAAQSDRLAPSTMAGMRITLRNIREAILSSHDVFANDLVSRTRGRAEMTAAGNPEASTLSQSSTSNAAEAAYGATGSGMGGVLSDPSRLGIRRQNLRASLEKVTE